MITRNTIRFAFLTALAASSWACAKPATTDEPSTTVPGAVSLDGKSFEGTVKLAGAAEGDPDTLVFDAGIFESTACTKFGFAKSEYAQSNDAGGVAFQATAQADGGAQMNWSGTVEGDIARATATWSKPGEPARTYEFEGTLRR
jgi:hypothetical protein